jgi:hypothetical protein
MAKRPPESTPSLQLKESIPDTTHTKLLPPALYKSLEQWSKQLFEYSNQDIEEESPTIALSRFGLKTPEAIAKFLMSPAGEQMIVDKEEELALETTIEEERRMELREHELLKHRIKIALFLSYVNKKTHAAKKLHELIISQAEKSLEQLHRSAETSKLKTPSQYEAEIDEVLRHYDEAIKTAQTQQSELQSQEQSLLNDLDTLKQSVAKRQEKYDLFEAHLNESHFNDLEAHLDDYVAGKTENNLIANTHADLSEQMNILYTHIDGALENNGDPAHLIQQQNALNLKLAALHDMIAVHKKDKLYINDEGMPAESRMKASFVLNKEDSLIRKNKLSRFTKKDHLAIHEHGQIYLLKPEQNWATVKNDPNLKHEARQRATELVDSNEEDDDDDDDGQEITKSDPYYFVKKGYFLIQEHGKVYLLKASDDWNTVKDNPELKAEALKFASESFVRAKQDIMTVKNVIGDHKKFEEHAHMNKFHGLKHSMHENQAEQRLIANQITLLSASRASFQAAMQQTTPTNALRPTPTPSAPSITVKPNHHAMPRPRPQSTQVDKEKLLQKQYKRDLLALAGKTINPAQTQQSLKTLFDNKLKAGLALTPIEVATLQQRLRQLNISNTGSIARNNQNSPKHTSSIRSPFDLSGPKPD